MNPPPESPTFRQALLVWIKIGLLSFGGPAGQIALMHRELVEKRRWLSEHRFMHALNYCMLLPGPEAQQLAVYTGWLLHKTRGGIVAGALFVLPGALLMWVISYVYVFHGKLPWIEAVFYGLKAAVLAIVVSALARIGKKVLKEPAMWAVAAASLTGILVFKLPFPLVMLSALVIGLLMKRRQAANIGEQVIADGGAAENATPTLAGTLLKTGMWLVVWLLPLAICMAWLGPRHVLTSESLFFSKAALLTFGGAYAVLPYVAQQAVETHAWLTPGQMMDGLALAETTPGPLILVLQFVGFLGAWNSPGDLPPLAAATLGALLTVWATFIPGYLFIFAGAPFIERTRHNPRLERVLSTVTAAVVGVIANLALWFGWNVTRTVSGGFDPVPLVFAVVFLYLLQKKKCGVITIVGLGALAGLVCAPGQGMTQVFYALDAKVDLHQPPPGCWHRRTGMGSLAGASHRSLGMALPLLGVALFWNGIVSVFVLLAVSSTLHLLNVPMPEWFPAPRMNDEAMGTGMTIFLWIFLTPFIVIGLGMIGGFLSCLAGKTEVSVDRGVVRIATGIGPVRWNRRFQAWDLMEIRMEETRRNGNNGAQKKEIIAELKSGRLVRFGSMLRDERRRFLAAAADEIIRGQDSVAPLYQPA